MKLDRLIIVLITSTLTFLIACIISPANAIPFIKDPNLKVETFVKGLKFPTTIAFVGLDDLLVAEKNEGKVYRIQNGTLSSQPLIDLNVSIGDGRGLFGIAYEKRDFHNFVYLSFLKSSNNSDMDDIAQGKSPAGNVLYRYELVDGKLVNPLLVQNTTALPGRQHYGGPILVNSNSLYHMIGDAGPKCCHDTKAVNVGRAPDADGTAGIIKIPLDNSSDRKWVMGSSGDIRWYYAYGIRNSFGMDIDPVTGYFWDTENGPENSDELNLALPGFNSGWKVVQGPIYGSVEGFDPTLSSEPAGLTINFDQDLSADRQMSFVDFAGMGKYRDPEFTWHKTVGVTAVKFYLSDLLGKKYKNDMFVGDFNNGTLYDFHLSKNRTSLNLTGPLKDKIANSPAELSDAIIGTGFNGITDIKVGSDGYLYVVSHLDGAIYRIVPKNNHTSYD